MKKKGLCGLGYPVVDIHTHLRGDIPKHTRIARESGIAAVCYMANCNPPLDSLERIEWSLQQRSHCLAFAVSAITKGLEGKELVEIEAIRDYVVGFSDDGKYLADLGLLAEILSRGVLVMAHCSPAYEVGLEKPWLETQYIEQYLRVLGATGGKLHIQHVSKRESIELLRAAKRRGLAVTCETCPHYFSFSKHDLEVRVNPPLAEEEDILAIREGLADGTIDVIASDYAPEPRITGIAGFRAFIPLSLGLVLAGVLSEQQLKEKLCLNPQRIIGRQIGRQIGMERS